MRFKKSIQPNEIKNFYNPNTYFSIKLPRAKLDLHTFTLYYDGLPSNVGATPTRTTRRFFPRLSSCVVDELIVKINGQVKQYTREYNMFHATLNDIHKEYDDLDGTAFDTIQDHKFKNNYSIENQLKILSSSTAAVFPKFHDEFKESFFISEWIGFLNEGNSRFFDATDKDIEITIKLAPPSILYRGLNANAVAFTNTFVSDYRLSNIYATIDILDEIPEQPLEYEFLDYQYIEGQYNEKNKSSSTSFQIDKPIKYLLGTFSTLLRNDDSELVLQHANTDTAVYGDVLKDSVTLTDYNKKIPNGLLYSYEVAKNQKDPYLLNSSRYFIRDGLGISHTQFKMNTYDLTPQMNMLSCYNETKRCFNSKYKKVISLPSFQANFFVNAILVDDNTEELKNITWEVHSDNVQNLGGMPMLFCCFVNKV